MTDTVQTEAEAVVALNRQIEQLERALESRDVIGQAKGILMERFRITADEAFDRLRMTSQHTNRKVNAVAGELAATGEWPILGPRPSEARGRGCRP